MKFLHIADLHLGKRLNDLSLLEDQVQVLSQIASVAKAEQVDAVLIAGDVYQNASPQGEAMTVFDGFLTQLCGEGIRVFLISGNHDSQQRIAYFSSLIRGAGVYAAGEYDGTLRHFDMEDAHGILTVHLLPFVKPVQVRRCFPNEKIDSYQDAVSAVIRHASIDESRRNVLVCHQFITGAERSDSEEVMVGGLDNIDAHVFDAFDYVALGHIHKAQKVFRDTLRYAGAPMKYSFSEVNHHKSVTCVELGAKGDVQVKKLPLTAPHDMRLVDGLMAEVLDMPYSEDYVWVTIHDELPAPDAQRIVSTVFPNLLKFTVDNSKTRTDVDVVARDSLEEKTVEELFCDFYRLQNNDVPPGEAHLRLLSQILEELREEEA